MLRPRIIPCLLLEQKGLVKTRRFAEPRYVGDPLNAVRIFNEKEVDEIMVLDISATRRGTSPNLKLIQNLAAECRMPLCYGGGITTVEEAAKIIGLGVEKVSLGASVISNPRLIANIAREVGSQSVVAVVDVKSEGPGSWIAYTHNGTQSSGRSAVDVAREAEALGAGEIVVNSIDRDGVMGGYDLDLARSVRGAVTVPMTVLGGAGSLADIKALIHEFGIVGAAAGSLFVFNGPYRAVLITYPRREMRAQLYVQ